VLIAFKFKSLGSMSRCIPFPPPGYVWNGVGGEALIELIKVCLGNLCSTVTALFSSHNGLLLSFKVCVFGDDRIFNEERNWIHILCV
jgi:hypothetical protein